MSGYPYHGSEHYPATPGHAALSGGVQHTVRRAQRAAARHWNAELAEPAEIDFVSGRRDGVHDREAR